MPYSVFDGNVHKGNSTVFFRNSQVMDSCVLIEPKFKIDTFHFDGLSNSISFSTKITALSNFVNQSMSVYSIVIEQNIDTILPIAFRNVVKQILPNVAGVEYTRDWNINDTETVNINHDIDFTIYNPDTIAIVVFVQNNETKEVYQVETSTNYTVSTELKEIIKEYAEKGFTVYPNPATNYANVYLKETTNNSYEIQVLNNLGALVKTIKSNAMENVTQIDLNGMNTGNYLYVHFHQKQNTA